MAEDYLAQGTAAARAGNIQEARRLLAKAIFAAPNDERTWGRFYLVASTDQERVDCLKQILRINPENETAGELLKKYASVEQPSQPSIKDKKTKKNEIKEKEKIARKKEIIEKKTIKEKKKTAEKKQITPPDFRNDLLVRKVSKYLLIFQGSALLVGIVFLLFHKSSIALLVAGIALVPLLGTLLWVYLRYRSYPLVKEKRTLDQHASRLQAQINANAEKILSTHQTITELEQAEKNEISGGLYESQKKYIETGMQEARIAEADIPGIEPELKQRLVDHGFASAADINIKVTYVEGVIGDKRRAILDWQDRVYFEFHATRPVSLPPERQVEIQKKYEVLHANNIAERRKLEQKQIELENAIKEFQPGANTLAPFTFPAFLRHGLARRAFLAALVGIGIIGSPLALGISAAVAAIKASLLRGP